MRRPRLALDTPIPAANTPRVRVALALAAVALLLLGAAAPHVHAGVLGTHGCVACVTAGGEESSCQTPDAAPRAVHAVDVARAAPRPPVTGVALGAIPGQSPPA